VAVEVFGQFGLLEIDAGALEDLGIDLCPALKLGRRKPGGAIDEDPATGSAGAFLLLLLNQSDSNGAQKSVVSERDAHFLDFDGPGRSPALADDNAVDRNLPNSELTDHAPAPSGRRGKRQFRRRGYAR